MQPFETWLKADLQAPVTVKRIDGNLFSGDNQGNLVGVTVTDAGEPATLSGEVRGYFIRSDGNTVIMSGTIDGNKVTVVLPSACYTVVGQFSLVIKVGQVAVGACTGYVYQSNTDSTVDPEHVIPDIDQLLTRVEALEGRATTLEGDVSAQNNTINAIEDGLAIIATGNVHPAIANGQFVYVKGHSSLAEGLYRATAAIGTNATLSTSNLTADGSGGLNALKGEVDSLNSKITPIYSYDLGTTIFQRFKSAHGGVGVYGFYTAPSDVPSGQGLGSWFYLLVTFKTTPENQIQRGDYCLLFYPGMMFMGEVNADVNGIVWKKASIA